MTPPSTSVLFGPARTILLISPQPWDSLRVSKHHYAIELAGLGHRVFFLEPPQQSGRAGAVTVRATETEGLRCVTYTPWFPYVVKFHARRLFDILMRRQARLILAALDSPPDIIWDFDNVRQFADLRWFGDAVKIFHPVDDIPAGSNARGADFVFAVSDGFLDRFCDLPRRSMVTPHGLGHVFEMRARDIVEGRMAIAAGLGRRVVGYFGNLDHPDLDWVTILSMLDQCPAVDFIFVGPGGDEHPAAREARTRANARFPGRRTQAEILDMAAAIDLWLVCYDPSLGGNGAINSHKVLEYLATGKAVVGSYLAAYAGSDLYQAPTTPSNIDLPAVLQAALDNIEGLNGPDAAKGRAAFALEHTYRAHLRRMDDFMMSSAFVAQAAQ